MRISLFSINPTTISQFLAKQQNTYLLQHFHLNIANFQSFMHLATYMQDIRKNTNFISCGSIPQWLPYLRKHLGLRSPWRVFWSRAWYTCIRESDLWLKPFKGGYSINRRVVNNYIILRIIMNREFLIIICTYEWDLLSNDN